MIVLEIKMRERQIRVEIHGVVKFYLAPLGLGKCIKLILPLSCRAQEREFDFFVTAMFNFAIVYNKVISIKKCQIKYKQTGLNNLESLFTSTSRYLQ